MQFSCSNSALERKKIKHNFWAKLGYSDHSLQGRSTTPMDLYVKVKSFLWLSLLLSCLVTVTVMAKYGPLKSKKWNWIPDRPVVLCLYTYKIASKSLQILFLKTTLLFSFTSQSICLHLSNVFSGLFSELWKILSS